jgi:hypothetical protein
MLIQELAAVLASGRNISDAGLTRKRIEENERLRCQRLVLARALKRLEKHLQQLEHMGVTVIANPDPDPDQPHKHFHFISAKTDDALLVARHAFAVGVYSQRLAEQSMAYFLAIAREQQAKKAGRRGGMAVTTAANNRKEEVWKAYVEWSKDTANEGQSDSRFCESFAQKKKARFFSKGTIHRVIKELHTRILTRTKALAIKDLSLGARVKAVAKAMDGEPGISQETVRRALK